MPTATPRRPRPATAPTRPRLLSAPHNTKLGEAIWTFSLPAVDTCPGLTAACKAVCYALRGHFTHGANKRRYEANYERSLEPDFAEQLIREIRDRGVKYLRIHVSGDFYSAAYVDDWIEVARRCPDVTIYAYTRSWRSVGLKRVLTELASLPNVHPWFSTDAASTRKPGRPDRTRFAWLSTTPAEEPKAPGWADLLFRNRPKEPAKRINGVLICPVEQKTPASEGMTCTRCKICYTDRRLKPPAQTAG